MALTVSTLIQQVREAAFDRFPVPVLLLKKLNVPTWKLRVSSTGVTITQDATEKFNFPIAGKTYAELLESVILDDDEFSVATTGAYNRDMLIKDLTPCNSSFIGIVSVNRAYLHEEEAIKALLINYFLRYSFFSCACTLTDTEINNYLSKIPCVNENHVKWWLAYHLVEQRRLLEMAGRSLQITFTNDSDGFCAGVPSLFPGSSTTGGSISASVADVFSINFDDSSQFSTDKDLSLPGADNVFGDEGFWYRLQLYLRENIEKTYKDYSLRTSQVMQGELTLEKSYLNNTYYDSFPYDLRSGSGPISQNCSE